MPACPVFRQNFRLDIEHRKYIALNFLQLKSKTLKEITVQNFCIRLMLVIAKEIKKQQTQETVLTGLQRFSGLSVLVLKRAIIYQRKSGTTAITHQDKNSLCFSQQQQWFGIKSDPESSGCRQVTPNFLLLCILENSAKTYILVNLRMFTSKLFTFFFYTACLCQ